MKSKQETTSSLARERTPQPSAYARTAAKRAEWRSTVDSSAQYASTEQRVAAICEMRRLPSFSLLP